MFTYYVHIPDSQFPTAEVEASSTKHARTAYLDYLSRNGKITWQQRQSVRPAIKVSRMQPGEFQTQIHLEYGLKAESPVKEVEAPPVEATEAGIPQEEQTEQDRITYRPGLETQLGREMSTWKSFPEEEGQQVKPPLRDPFGNSPIVQLSRKSRGM